MLMNGLVLRTNLNAALCIKEDVVGFDITVDDIPLVQVVEAGEDLANPVADERFLEGTVIAEERSDGTTRNVFQENVEMILVDT